MGKEWLYWGGGGGTRSTKKKKGNSTLTSGCMCAAAVFQLFDNFPRLHFPTVPPHQYPSFLPVASLDLLLPQEPNILLKGIEAPRNSLESEWPLKEEVITSSTMKQQHSFNLPMGIQIETSSANPNSKSRTDDLSSECGSSPGTKTPSLVARLMGLDLLPELSSPWPSASSNPPSNSSPSSHCRSLPSVSMARLSDSDNYHHRISLQANKENIFTSEELSKWPDVQRLSSYLNAKLDRRRESNRTEEDIKSSSLHAKQIVKQVKENISRSVGTDITNTTMARKEHRRDEHLVLLNSKKPLTRKGGQDDQSTLSCSPRLRSLEIKTKPISVQSSATKTQNSVFPNFHVASSKEKITTETYDARLKRPAQIVRNKKEEPFIYMGSPSPSKVKLSNKKCRKTPLSNNLVNISSPKYISFKKDPSPSTPILSKNQGTISKAQYNCIADNNSNGVIIPTRDVEYISRLLRRNGIDKTTLTSIKQSHSPSQSHPLHPSIFQHSTATTTPITDKTQMCGRELINSLSKKIGSFPAVGCNVLEEIDALINGDLCRSRKLQRSIAFEEEGEGIVMEIEREIVDTLVHETALMMWQGRTIHTGERKLGLDLTQESHGRFT